MARAFVAGRLAALGPAGFAREIEPLLGRASAHERERRGLWVTASFIAHASARGEDAQLAAIGAAAAEAGLPFARSLFDGSTACAPRASLSPGARLAEVGIPVFADLSGIPTRPYPTQTAREWYEMRAWFLRSPGARLYRVRPSVERWRLHHDPVFIGRLLDQRWLSLRDTVWIAARRPTIPAILLAVATRDRWFCFASVREALGNNPYTPPMLARALRGPAPPDAAAPVEGSASLPAPAVHG
jgi:hypothetical protein